MFDRKFLKSVFPYWILIIFTFLGVKNHCFFWDTVQLASKHAHWFYENNFQYLLLPDNIDSGHPPLFGIYLALLWKIFGKTLVVSHLATLPFLFGIIFLLQKIGQYFGQSRYSHILILLVLFDPFFAGQSVLVSPDIILIFAFLLSFYAILTQNIFYLVLGNILLGLISMRGMMVSFALYIWWLMLGYFRLEEGKKFTWYQKLMPFIPAGGLALLFLIYHFIQKGWIGYHPNSPWAGSFEKIGFYDFIKNIGILVWRFLDYGRFALFFSLMYLLFLYFKKIKIRKKFPKEIYALLLLVIILLLILTPSLLLHKGLLSHRYLLPITLSFTLLFYRLIIFIWKQHYYQICKNLYAFTFIVLITGNLWIYPRSIAQGWDATLAHLPYYQLRMQMIHFIDQQQISYAEIGTVFPNIGTFELYDLNNRKDGFVRKDFNKNTYILYSNVYNDFSDEELAILETWELIQKYQSNGIEVILYKKINQ